MSTVDKRPPRRAIMDGSAPARTAAESAPPDRGRAPLLEVGGRPPLGLYLHQLLQRRHFAFASAAAQATSRYKNNILGNLWMVLQPTLNAGAYFVIFALILRTDRGMDNFFAFIVLGIFLFQYSTRCLNAGNGLMRGGRGLIRAFSFPRAALPLAALLREMITLVPILLTALVLIIIVPPHAYPNRLWLLLPALVALQSVFNFGLLLLVARITNAIPDIGAVINVVSRFWMYGSGVLFSIDRFVDNPTFSLVMQFNPLYHVLEIARAMVIDATLPPTSSWLLLAGFAVVTAVIGFLYFWQGEVDYGRE